MLSIRGGKRLAGGPRGTVAEEVRCTLRSLHRDTNASKSIVQDRRVQDEERSFLARGLLISLNRGLERAVFLDLPRYEVSHGVPYLFCSPVHIFLVMHIRSEILLVALHFAELLHLYRAAPKPVVAEP